MALTDAQVDANSQALGLPAYSWNLVRVVQSLQNGQVSGATGVPAAQGFTAGALAAAVLQTGSVTGDVTESGTAVNTGAVPDGVTPLYYFVQTGPVGAAIASYSGGAGGTFSVNASATGTVTVLYLY